MSTLNRTNTYPGKCCVCGDKVGRQKGYLLPADELADPSICKGRWATICTSKLCRVAVLGQDAAADVDRRELLADGVIMMPYEEDALPLLRAIASWDHAAKTWQASPLYRDRDLVLRVAEKLGLEVSPEFAAYEDPEPVRLAVQRAKAAGARPYQVDGVRWLAYRGTTYGAPEGFEDKKPGAMLADDPGLGKSLEWLFSLSDDEAMLVECPANAKAVWPRQAATWRPERFDKITICEGAESFKWPDNPRELVVINYDILPFTPPQIKQERETLLGKRRGVKPDPRASKKAEREGKVGLLAPMFTASLYEGYVRRKTTTTAQRHELYLARCRMVECAAKLRNNFRALVRNAKRKPAGQPNCKTYLVADEAHYLQNNKAARTVKHRYIAKRATRLVCGTGTPVEDDPLKMWGVLQSARCNPFSWTSFKEQFNAYDGAWGGLEFRRHPPREGSTAKGPVIVQPGTTEILSRALLRRTAEQVLKDLPPKIFSEIPVEISAKLIKLLDEITAANIDTLMQGGLPTFGMTSEVRKLLALASIPAALREVESYELAGIPLLIFSAHRAPILKVKGRTGWEVITGDVSSKARGEIQDAFQAGELIGVAGTQAMCEAMTLTRASTVLQVDPFWRRQDNIQAYKRAHRLGQKDTVHVVRLVPDHPLTRHCADLLAGKDQFFDDVLHGEAEYEAPPSRSSDDDHDAWTKRVEAKHAKDEERAAAAQVREARKLERELAEISRRNVTPKVSEARAAARAERLGASALHHDAPAHVVTSALEYMLSICDGAETKDDQGFNQPDSCVARWLAPGVRKGSEYATASAAAILRHYPRQLRGSYPELFTN